MKVCNMTFTKAFRYITDRPFLMALIVFVTLFVIYNFVFKDKNSSQPGTATIAQTAIPTSGRPVIYNQEFKQYPVSTNPPPAQPIPIPVPVPPPIPPVNNYATRIANGTDDTLQGYSNYFGTPVVRLFDLNPTLKKYGANGVIPAGTVVVVMTQ